MPPRKPEEEKEVLEWVESVLEEPLPKGDFEEVSSEILGVKIEVTQYRLLCRC